MKKIIIALFFIALQAKSCYRGELENVLQGRYLDKAEQKLLRRYIEQEPKDIALLKGAIMAKNLEKVGEILNDYAEKEASYSSKHAKVQKVIDTLPGDMQQRIQQLTYGTLDDISLHSAAYSRNRTAFQKCLNQLCIVEKDEVIKKLFALDVKGYSVFAAAYVPLSDRVPRKAYIGMFEYILFAIKDILKPIHFTQILEEMVRIREQQLQFVSERYISVLSEILASHMDPRTIENQSLMAHFNNTRMVYFAVCKNKLGEAFKAKGKSCRQAAKSSLLSIKSHLLGHMPRKRSGAADQEEELCLKPQSMAPQAVDEVGSPYQELNKRDSVVSISSIDDATSAYGEAICRNSEVGESSVESAQALDEAHGYRNIGAYPSSIYSERAANDSAAAYGEPTYKNSEVGEPSLGSGQALDEDYGYGNTGSALSSVGSEQVGDEEPIYEEIDDTHQDSDGYIVPISYAPSSGQAQAVGESIQDEEQENYIQSILCFNVERGDVEEYLVRRLRKKLATVESPEVGLKEEIILGECKKLYALLERAKCIMVRDYSQDSDCAVDKPQAIDDVARQLRSSYGFNFELVDTFTLLGQLFDQCITLYEWDA